MKTIRLLSLLLLSTLCFVPAAQAAEALSAAEKNLVGLWEEYSPGSNVVEFNADRTLKIYLTEEEGKQMELHWVDANWSIDAHGVMTMTITKDGQSFKQSAKIQFKNGEMWLSEEDGSTTKNRKISAVPAKYKW